MPTSRIEFAAPMAGVDTTRRTITGRVAVLDELTSDGRRIQITAGALQAPAPVSRVKLLVDHDHTKPVGYMSQFNVDTLEATFAVPEGEAGDRALADAANGLRDGLSVGIYWLPDGYHVDPAAETITITAARLSEVSLVAIPAFESARVLDVTASAHPAPPREEPPMPETPDAATFTVDQEQAIHDLIGEQVRTFAATLDRDEREPLPAFASFGAFVRAFAAGDDQANTLAAALVDPTKRAGFAYAGSTTSDDAARNAWVADAIRLVERRRPILDLFQREILPPTGMTLEYARLNTNTIQVDKQAAEGDVLAFGKIDLTTATAPVETFGGYTTVSRQVIDRASDAYLSTVFKAMTIEYARATEAAARAGVKALIATEAAANPINVAATLDAASATDWIDAMVDAAIVFDDEGLSLDGMLVAADVFKRLAALETAGGDRLMGLYGTGVNQIGEISVPGLAGNLVNIPVRLSTTLDAGTAAPFDRIAFTSWESPGAPFRLQDDEAKSLTTDYSVYGYAAFASQYAGAIRPLAFQAG